MLYQRSNKLLCFIGITWLLWGTTTITSVETSVDAEFSPNAKCEIGNQEERTLTTPALLESPSEFDEMPKDSVCTNGQDLVLKCRHRSSGPIYWDYRTRTTRCQSHGNMAGAAVSTLKLPCDSYAVQCVALNGSIFVASRVAHITQDYGSTDLPETKFCMDGEANPLTFFCHANMDEVMSTRWRVGQEECPTKYISSDGLRLDLPCTLKNHEEMVSCQVEYRGGIINKTVGMIQVNQSRLNNQVNKKVDAIDGPPTTMAPSTQDVAVTPQLTALELGLAITVAITLLIILLLIAVIVVTCLTTRHCVRNTKVQKEEEVRPQDNEITKDP